LEIITLSVTPFTRNGQKQTCSHFTPHHQKKFMTDNLKTLKHGRVTNLSL